MSNQRNDNSSMPLGKKRNVPENNPSDNNSNNIKRNYVNQIGNNTPQKPQTTEIPQTPEPEKPEEPAATEPLKLSHEEIMQLPLRRIHVGGKHYVGYYDEERLEVHLADEDGQLIGKVGKLHRKLAPETPETDLPDRDTNEDKTTDRNYSPYPDEQYNAADNIANKLMKVKERRYKLHQKKKNEQPDEQQAKKKKIYLYVGLLIGAIMLITISYNYLSRSAFLQDETQPPVAEETPGPTPPSLSDGELTVIELNTDVIAGDEITEDMLTMATIDSQSYNQIAITGKDLYRWEQRDNIIGMYATEYISQGHYITTDSLSKIVRDANNPWILNNNQTAYTDIPVSLTSLSPDELLIGNKVKIEFEVEVNQQGSMDDVESNTDGVDVQSGQKTVTINSYTVNNAVISDMYTEDNRSLFNIYSALLSVPEGNQEFYLTNVCSKNPDYLTSIEPVKIRIYFDKAYADALATAVSTKQLITVTAGSDADTSTTEKKAFYDGELALKTSFANLTANMEQDTITVKKGDNEQ